MRDWEVRAGLHAYLRSRLGIEDQVVVDELGLCGLVRVDVAVVGATLQGYEIKGSFDDLRRLAGQVDIYSRVLDRAVLVVTERHLAAAVERLPSWWGCLLAHPASEGVRFDLVREGRPNDLVDPASLVQLLWRDEALSVLEQWGAARGVRGGNRKAIWSRLVQTVDLPTLRAEVMARLQERRVGAAAR